MGNLQYELYYSLLCMLESTKNFIVCKYNDNKGINQSINYQCCVAHI